MQLCSPRVSWRTPCRRNRPLALGPLYASRQQAPCRTAPCGAPSLSSRASGFWIDHEVCPRSRHTADQLGSPSPAGRPLPCRPPSALRSSTLRGRPQRALSWCRTASRRRRWSRCERPPLGRPLTARGLLSCASGTAGWVPAWPRACALWTWAAGVTPWSSTCPGSATPRRTLQLLCATLSPSMAVAPRRQARTHQAMTRAGHGAGQSE
mmetsp:Transcript_23022/g.53863  ORF Transcript_23022/g.53863 Transcript_23022/m.53863 type:complete len:209 (-) Transcript_23022:742-1368(-)